ncbi:hypothetical protein [Sphingomonas sp.]|uniref:hypothetical protein n=1 Tax=Sphingomonas sp. TaxID=28214 RepID=UPI003D6CB1EB
MTNSRTGGIVDLYDRISRKIEQGKPMAMSAEELDWFVVSGAYGTLLQAVARRQFDICRERIEARGGDVSFLLSAKPEVESPIG